MQAVQFVNLNFYLVFNMWNLFSAKEKDQSIIECERLLAEEKKKIDEARELHQIEVRKQIPSLGSIYYGTMMNLSSNPSVTIY